MEDSCQSLSGSEVPVSVALREGNGTKVDESEKSYGEKRLWPEDEDETSSTCITYIETTVQIESFGSCRDERGNEVDSIEMAKCGRDSQAGNGNGNEKGHGNEVMLPGTPLTPSREEEVTTAETSSQPQPNDMKDKRRKRKKRSFQRASSDNNGVKHEADGTILDAVGSQPENNGHGRKRSRSRHVPSTDPRNQNPNERTERDSTKSSQRPARFPLQTSSLKQLKRKHVALSHQLQRNAFSFESTLDNGRNEEIKEKLRSLVEEFSRRASRTKEKIQKPVTPTSDDSDHSNEEASEPKLMSRMAEFFPNSAEGSHSNIYHSQQRGVGSAFKTKAFQLRKLLLNLLGFRYVLDNQSVFYVGWLMVVSTCFVYNAWVISLRGIFPYQTDSNVATWFLTDSLADLIYFVDTVAIRSNIKFIRSGFWVKDPKEIRRNYFHSFHFKVGLLSLFPLDIFYALFVANQPWLRLPRLLKIETFWELFRRFDSVLSSPHPVRIVRSVLYMLYLIHIYACAYYTVSSWESNAGIRTDWIYDGVGNAYIRCFHFATKTVTSIGKNPKPENEIEYLFMTCAWLSGVFVFAILIGQIRDIIATATKNQTEYRQLLYATMNYLHRIGVPRHLQQRVQLWLTYTWQQQKTLDETEIVSLLPHKMQTDIALHVHIGMLNKVKLFQHCEVAFLRDLVLKLRSIIFLPGDFVCRKGEVGREMYIVKSGRVDVIGGDLGNEKLLASLHAGSVFGEIALLQIGGMDKRTADVKSAGFSNLFVLNKKDIEEVVKDYPDAQESLRKQARRLMKQKARGSKGSKVSEKEKEKRSGGVRRNETQSTELTTTKASTLVSPVISDSDSEPHTTHIIIKGKRKLPQPKLIDTVLQLLPLSSKTAQYLQYGSKVASSTSFPSSVDVDSFSSYPPSPFLPASQTHFSSFNGSMSNSSSETALSIPPSGPQTTKINQIQRESPSQPSEVHVDARSSKPVLVPQSELDQEQVELLKQTERKWKVNKIENSSNVSGGIPESEQGNAKARNRNEIVNEETSNLSKIPLSVSLSIPTTLLRTPKSKLKIKLSPTRSLPQFDSQLTGGDSTDYDFKGNHALRTETDCPPTHLGSHLPSGNSSSAGNIEVESDSNSDPKSRPQLTRQFNTDSTSVDVEMDSKK